MYPSIQRLKGKWQSEYKEWNGRDLSGLRVVIEETPVTEIDDISEYVNQDWYALVDSWNRQEEPKPNPMSWECGYCSYCEHGQAAITEKKNGKRKVEGSGMRQAFSQSSILLQGNTLAILSCPLLLKA